MKIIKIASLSFLFLVLISCNKTDIDDQKPIIDFSATDAFPNNCDTIYFGEAFNFKMHFADNAELGSYSIAVHHNFEHHSHTTDVSECEHSPEKEPVNPLVNILEKDIPEGMKSYQADTLITFPDNGYDEGDYHFFISLTDREGWRAEKGISIKILSKP